MIRLCAFSDEYGSSLDAQIEGLKKNGISLMEIRNVDGVNIAKMTEEMAADYAARLKEAGISVWSIGSPLGKVDINEDFEAYKKVVHHVCKLANIFGAKRIRMFSFYNAFEVPELVVERLKEMVAIGDQYGVEMCHENEKKIYGDVISRVEYLRDNVPGMKFVYDPANFLQCDQNCGEALDALLECTSYFHIKDAFAAGAIVPPHCGEAKIREILTAHSCLAKNDFFVSLEPHLQTFSGLNALTHSTFENPYKYESQQAAFADAVLQFRKGL
jgi:sugar phosphate isomerase/epimerase